MKKVIGATLAVLMLLLTGCTKVVSLPPQEELITTSSENETSSSQKDISSSGKVSALTYENRDVENEKGFYYSLLSDAEKKVYEEMYIIFRDRIEDKKVSTLEKEEVERAGNAVLYDHPELFYVDTYSYSIYSLGDEVTSISPKAICLYDAEETALRQKKIDEAVDGLLKTIPQDASDYDRIKAVFDYIILNTEYRIDAEDDQNICSVFINGESVCNGYSKAFMYVMNKLGIESTIVFGEAIRTGRSHAWNIVKADGNWYQIDTTWGDGATYSSYDDYDELTEMVNYDFFLVPTSWVTTTHEIINEFPIPECTEIADNYFVHEGCYFDSVNSVRLKELFDKAYANDENCVRFRSSDKEVFEDWKAYLLTGKHIFDFVKDKDRVMYVPDEETYTFIVLLK